MWDVQSFSVSESSRSEAEGRGGGFHPPSRLRAPLESVVNSFAGFSLRTWVFFTPHAADINFLVGVATPLVAELLIHFPTSGCLEYVMNFRSGKIIEMSMCS